MSSPRVHETTRAAVAMTAALLIALALPLSTATAAEKIRTDAGDIGYAADSSAAPLSMLLYEPVLPVPVEPGDPHGEGSLSYTSTKLETGPVARAVASSVWPGPAVGDGFSTICSQPGDNFERESGEEVPDCEEEWRVKAEGRYPGEHTEGSKEVPSTGAGMHAAAKGLDVVARASSAESPNAEAFTVGNVRSRSETTVDKETVIASTVSSATDVVLGGGVITIEGVRTVLEATSDAKKGATKGRTAVNGLVIGGHGYTVDEKGVKPKRDGKDEDAVAQLPQMPNRKQMREQLGIDVVLAEHAKSVKGADASHKAGGLRISINTRVLKDAVTEHMPMDEINDGLDAPFNEMPEEMSDMYALRGAIGTLVALAPRIDFVFGRGQVRAAGIEALALDFDFGLAPPPMAPPAGGTTGAPALDAGALPDTSANDTALPAAAEAPAVAGDGGEVAAPVAAGAQSASAELPAFFGGLPPGLVAASLVVAALAGRALAGFTGMAMGGASGAFCERGAARRVPDLRR